MTTTATYTYETDLEWVGERRGILRSPTLSNIRIDAPPEFKGHEQTWTPEHLFVGAVNSCFMTTFLAISELSKLEFESFHSQAIGKLEKVDGIGLMLTEVVLRPRLVLAREEDAARAARILEKAERNCLVTNSIRSEVRLEPEIVFASGPVRT